MKSLVTFLIIVSSILLSQDEIKDLEDRIISKIDSSRHDNLVLIQEFTVNTALSKAWKAYTVENEYKKWAAPLVRIDFKIGGTIKTNYNINGKIGDKTTIVTNIINYVSETLITLQAEISPHFPEFMKKDAKDFYNVIYFEKISETKSKIISYGIGYKKSEKYMKLLNYFITANESVLKKLIIALER